MPIVTIQTKDGPVTAFICGGPKPKLCKFCGGAFVAKLCDFVTGKNKTCDAGMYDKCATTVGKDLDYCPTHKREAAPPQQSLFGGGNEAA